MAILGCCAAVVWLLWRHLSAHSCVRAVLQAVMQFLRLALPLLTVWVDNQGIIDGCQCGRTWCCATARPAADLWREFWRLLGEIGDGVHFRRCKGHTTEAIIQANLGKITRGRTVIIVSHRLASLTSCDNIVVLDQGKVFEQGRHSELVAGQGIYAQLWRQQTDHMSPV